MGPPDQRHLLEQVSEERYRYPGGNEFSSIFLIVFRDSPKYRAAARRLLPSTRIARRTRAYTSTSYMPPVFHGKHTSSPAPNPLANLVRYRSKAHAARETRMWRGGLLLLRHVTPLPRRNVVYFCSVAYNLFRLA